MECITKAIEFPQIETERLILREINYEDRYEIFQILSKDEVIKYYGMYPTASIKEADGLIAKFSDGFKATNTIRWGITLKENNKLIGTCGFHNLNEKHFRAEMGYELSSTYWKYGYMKESVDAIIRYGFDKMNLNRIEAVIYPENTSSRTVLERAGFKEEGLLKEYACFRDKFEDLIMFSLLKRNWNPQ